MTPQVDALIRGLAESTLNCAASLQELQDGMARRAPLFAQLAQLEPADLSRRDKVRLRKALEGLAAADQRVIERLESEKRGVAEMLESVAGARGAVRGYRGSAREAGAVLQTA